MTPRKATASARKEPERTKQPSPPAASEEAQGAGATLSELLRTHGPHLTTSERKVAQVLQLEYPKAGLGSLPSLAQRARVSAPTALRMLAKLGYSSYGDFQESLRQEVFERMSMPADRTPSPSAAADDLEATLDHVATTLTHTAARVGRADFREVVDLLCDTDRPVLTFGGFESEICSNHLLNLLGQVRPRVHAMRWGPTGASPMDVLDITKRHVIVAFDFRRYQQMTMNYVQVAAQQHATVVLFTDRWMSPAAELARYVFVCDTTGPGAFDSRASAIALIEALVATTTARMGPEPEERLNAIYELLTGSTWGEGLLPENH